MKSLKLVTFGVLFNLLSAMRQQQQKNIIDTNQPPQIGPRGGRQMVTNGGQFVDCPCAVNFRCPTCGPSGYEGNASFCPCMPQPSCPNCIMGKILKSYHEKSASIAKRDAVTQGKLASESLLEKKLFEQAQVYAQEAAVEEKAAKEAAIQLQEHANKAALARQKMIRTENQAKQVAMKAIQTLSQASTLLLKDQPQFQITPTGTRHVAITQNTPEYQVQVGVGAGDGYYDQTNQLIKNDIPEHDFMHVQSSNVPQEQPVIPSQFNGQLIGNNYVQGVPILPK